MLFLHCVFIKVMSSLKRRGKLSERRKLKQKGNTNKAKNISNSAKDYSKLKRTPLKRIRLSLKHSISSSFNLFVHIQYQQHCI